MKERPIWMSGPMVKAILEGCKTQTRRVVKCYLAETLTFLDCEDARDTKIQYFKGGHGGDGYYGYCTEYPDEGAAYLGIPYGQPGDRLWVRERHSLLATSSKHKYVLFSEGAQKFEDGEYFPGLKEYSPGAFDHIKWRSSIHMPRWASRITLEVQNIRVERLQEIVEDDAKAEGIIKEDLPPDPDNFHPPGFYGFVSGLQSFPQGTIHINAIKAFQELWNSINLKRGYGWDKNPWVWLVEFKVSNGKLM